MESLKIDVEARTVEISFSSDFPVERSFGYEILEHTAGAADLTRLNSRAPLLLDHDKTRQIGVVERAWIEGNKGKALVRFSRSKLGEEVFQDVQDGIRSNTSFGYNIRAYKEGTRNNEMCITATRWEPFELTLTSVPADITVGAGRSKEGADDDTTDTGNNLTSQEVTDDNTPPLEKRAANPIEVQTKTMPEETNGLDKELNRLKTIEELGRALNEPELARDYIASNKTPDEFRTAVLEKRQKANERQVDDKNTAASLDLSKKDKKRYSIMRALQSILMKDEKLGGFELECSRALADNLGKKPQGIYVPYDILLDQRSFNREVFERAGLAAAFRDLSVGLGTQPTDGGALVGTDLLAGSFIDLLRSRTVVSRLGARVMPGLVGNIAIPRQNSAGTTYWVAEGGSPTESQLGVAQLPMSPKTLGAYTEMTRLLILQSTPAVEQLVLADLTAIMARAIDKAAMFGSGSSNQPKGVVNQTGINTVTVGSSPAVFDWADAVDMETEILEDNAGEMGAMAYVTRPSHRGTLKKREKGTAGYPIYLLDGESSMNGYPVVPTTQVTANYIIFGDWSQIIIGQWGTLDLMVNPYAQALSGGLQISALQSVDIAVRYPEAFTVCSDFK